MITLKRDDREHLYFKQALGFVLVRTTEDRPDGSAQDRSDRSVVRCRGGIGGGRANLVGIFDSWG